MKTQNTQTPKPNQSKYEICVTSWNNSWCYEVKRDNLVKTLRKLLRRGDVLTVWIRPENGYYWIMINNEDNEGLKALLDGEEINVIYHLEHPFFNGCKAYGYGSTNLKKLLNNEY